MTLQTDAPLVHTSLHASNRQAREVANMAAAGDVLLDPPYQRGERWTTLQRVALVKSWLLGLPVPAVLINARYSNPAWRHDGKEYPADQPAYACIDGQQRIRAAIAWFSGDLAVPASWFPADAVDTAEDTDDGPYVRFPGLTRPGQMTMSNRAFLPVIEVAADTVQQEASTYLLINGAGTPQTEDDMNNARRVAQS